MPMKKAPTCVGATLLLSTGRSLSGQRLAGNCPGNVFSLEAVDQLGSITAKELHQGESQHFSFVIEPAGVDHGFDFSRNSLG